MVNNIAPDKDRIITKDICNMSIIIFTQPILTLGTLRYKSKLLTASIRTFLFALETAGLYNFFLSYETRSSKKTFFPILVIIPLGNNSYNVFF